ncbi:hypothetical protein Barb6_03051 [Bacteroidales bacterium Barb6]|nr:hypothetical protein Barb6_03051 [Bacteroidales bacterium Barb6]
MRTRAQVTHGSGSRRGNKVLEADEIFTTYTVQFVIRLYHRINPDMIIIHEGIKYRILDIDRQLPQQRIVITAEIISEPIHCEIKKIEL